LTGAETPVATRGHNSVAPDRLKSIVQRIERLNEEKAGLADDIREIFSEAKSAGYDTRIIRKVIAIRKRDKAERAKEAELIDLYLDAVGG
jgi:uncharacterized protein (UPF0335 family)